MLHVAAQGDTPLPLYLFWQLGLDLNQKDKRGSTPLHWACYSQSEVAMCYLLAWNPKLDIGDNEGFTPMHIAVRSIDNFESCRPIRSLLIQGASLNIRDKKNKLACDYSGDI